eukprot:3062421-Alexandrium_andersonii.AAC.1
MRAVSSASSPRAGSSPPSSAILGALEIRKGSCTAQSTKPTVLDAQGGKGIMKGHCAAGMHAIRGAAKGEVTGGHSRPPAHDPKGRGGLGH